MCRLSIVVPYDRDEAAFETSLVSVLENRPEYCEIIVSHDGQYPDPFDLGDEVRFVIAPGADSVSLIKAAVSAAMGRVVHVMMGGARATENWSEEPVSMFEQADLACVAPIIRDLSSGECVIAAGWRDNGSRLQQPIARGAKTPSRRDVAAIQGAYLMASFWRRSTLESILELPLNNFDGALDYVLATALQKSGWRCRLSPASEVVASPRALSTVAGVATSWSAIQLFRSSIGKERGLGAAVSGLLGAITSPFDGAAWGEMFGRLAAAFRSSDEAGELATEMADICGKIGPNAASEQILKMPNKYTQPYVGRRAA